MRSKLLFVYGTLRRGTGHRMQAMLARHAEFVAEASFPGRMFLVAHYPGVVDSSDPRDRVVGEIYRLAAPEPLLPRLDRYEACDPRKPESPYVRVVRDVRLASGEDMAAWIYLYNRSTDALRRIASGDFFKL